MSNQNYRPCIRHPNADVRHTYDMLQYVMNGLPSGEGIKGNHRYECVICGADLANAVNGSFEPTIPPEEVA